jgi:hypothetical protein
MKKTLLIAPALSVALLFGGCGTDNMTGADMSDLGEGILASGGAPPPSAPVITTVPLVSLFRQEVGNVEVWNNNQKLFVKVTADSGWMLAASVLAVESDLALIPQNRRGMMMPQLFPNKRTYNPLTQSDTYEFDLVWPAGTQLFISTYVRMSAPIYHPKLKRFIGNRTMFAWSAGSGFQDKWKYDTYFTDIIDKAIVIVVR